MGEEVISVETATAQCFVGGLRSPTPNVFTISDLTGSVTD